MLRYGWPAAVSSLAESVSFCIIILLVGQLGETELAATTLALNVNLLAFIPNFAHQVILIENEREDERAYEVATEVAVAVIERQ